jgi:riboflavin synthase
MFTGLVEETGTIADIRTEGGSRHITVEANVVVDALGVDDSIAIDGCCQTVVAVDGNRFTVVAVEETLKKTTLGDFTVAQQVNLERALRVGDRLGGHFVQGHVDCVGEIAEASERESSWIYWIRYPDEFQPLVIPVGSIAVNGVSLTAAEVRDNRCMVSIIPHTHEVTTFKNLTAGDRVNLEFDMIGKYIRNFTTTAGAA